jgi:endonuclease-3
MNAQKRHAIFARLREHDPHPVGELNYGTPFQLLVAVILSAQATDKSVNKATAPLFPVAPDAASMLALGEEGLAQYIRSIGLYRAKARNVIATCQLLIDKHAGEVPRDRAALEALPGVGRKTANVVLNIAFGEPVIAVDTHVFRVANRTGIAPGHNVKTVEAKLERTVPKEFLLHAHHWLILHGRYVCLARQPKCPSCTIADLCEFKHKTPAKPARKADAAPMDESAMATAPKRRRGAAAAKDGNAISATGIVGSGKNAVRTRQG